MTIGAARVLQTKNNQCLLKDFTSIKYVFFLDTNHRPSRNAILINYSPFSECTFAGQQGDTTPDFIPPIMLGLPGLYVDNVILFICVINHRFYLFY